MPGTIATPVSVAETTTSLTLPSETEAGLTERLRPGDSVDEEEGRAAGAGWGAATGRAPADGAAAPTEEPPAGFGEAPDGAAGRAGGRTSRRSRRQVVRPPPSVAPARNS